MRLISILAGVLCLSILGWGRLQSKPQLKTYTDWKDLSDLIGQVRADAQVPALGVAVAQGRQIQSAVVGVREINKPDKIRIGDRWLIGSVTKSMTATMIARLVDKGVLRWDMTISQAFPTMTMRPDYRDVTLLQLLQHRSGVQQDRTMTSEGVDEAAGTFKDAAGAREKSALFTLAGKPLFKAGEKMAYSNVGYSIAAHMAETMAKKPYERLMQDLVFKPLGMTSARIGVPGSPGNPGSPGQPSGHVYKDKTFEPHVIDEAKFIAIQAPAGLGVSMALTDLLKFARYHLDGLRGHVTLMSAANFAVLHTPALTGPNAYKYACGWLVDDKRTKDTFHWHNGTDGTFFAEVALWPDRDLAVVSIQNAACKDALTPPFAAILAVYNRYGK